MPEIMARGGEQQQSSDPESTPDKKRNSNREAKKETVSERETSVLPGVRSLSTPPGEPYNDSEYGRS